jgi:hypothetical protein
MEYIEVEGAYGRDYTSGKAMLADWKDGKDFHILTIGYPSYISIRDAKPGLNVMGRFKRHMNIVSLSSGR